MIDIKEAATRKIGPLPAFAWGGIVGGAVIAWRVLHGQPAGGSSGVQVIGGTGNIPFEDGAGGGGGGGGGTTNPPGTGSPPVGGSSGTVSNTQPTTYKLSIISRTQLKDTSGKVIGYGSSGTYTASIKSLFGKKWYLFKRKNSAGNLQWTIIPVGTHTVKVTPVT